MKSGEALNFLKSTGKRTVLWNGLVERNSKRGNSISEEPTYVQSGTDYKGKPDLASFPLKLRARHYATAQQAKNRQLQPSMLPESRNIGHTIWRRYPDGTLDVRDALSQLREALRKMRSGAPLNEVDALKIASVYEDYQFNDLLPEVVRLKAFLSLSEKQMLQKKNEEMEKEEALRAIVDAGGA